MRATFNSFRIIACVCRTTGGLRGWFLLIGLLIRNGSLSPPSPPSYGIWATIADYTSLHLCVDSSHLFCWLPPKSAAFLSLSPFFSIITIALFAIVLGSKLIAFFSEKRKVVVNCLPDQYDCQTAYISSSWQWQNHIQVGQVTQPLWASPCCHGDCFAFLLARVCS